MKPTSESDSQTPALHSLPLIVLQIKGPIPAFKNNKRAITDSRTGKNRTLTRVDVKARMEEIIESFVSQLYSKSRTIAAEMGTECKPLSLIASSMPADDCLSVIPKGSFEVEYVAPGEEGAEIIIEQIP